MTRSPRITAREVQRTLDAGRTVHGFVVTGTFLRITDTASRHRGGYWTQPLTIAQPTEEQLAALVEGDFDGIMVALKAEHPWLDGGTIETVTFTD